MGQFNNFKIADEGSDGKDELHVNLNRGKISVDASVTAFRFKDEDTKQLIFFIPSLNISGHGETLEEATEMAKLSLDDLFENLSSLSRKECAMYLKQLGWKQGLFRKDFSKVHVDAFGELKNFNVKMDKVEKVTLTTA